MVVDFRLIMTGSATSYFLYTFWCLSRQIKQVSPVNSSIYIDVSAEVIKHITTSRYRASRVDVKNTLVLYNDWPKKVTYIVTDSDSTRHTILKFYEKLDQFLWTTTCLESPLKYFSVKSIKCFRWVHKYYVKWSLLLKNI